MQLKSFNEAGGVDEFERRARRMRVPSRGSAVSLVCRFPRNGHLLFFLQPLLTLFTRYTTLGQRIGLAESLGARQPSSFARIQPAVREPRPTKNAS